MCEKFQLFLYLYVFFTLYKCIFSIPSEKYFIVIPRSVNSNGHPFTTNSLRDHNVNYVVNLEGRDYQLDLNANHNLNMRNTKVLRTSQKAHGNGNFAKAYVNKGCHFVGTVKGFPNSKVALTNCNGLMGSIKLNDKLYFIEPVKDNSTVKRDDGYPHAVFVNKGSKKEQNNICNNKSRRRKRSTGRRDTDHNPGHLRRLYVEITLVLDKTLIDYHSDVDLDSYMIAVMNVMNLVMNEDPDKVLEVFEAWQKIHNPKHDTHPDHHDMAILITRIDICTDQEPYNCGLLGVTRYSALCDPDASSMLAEDNGLVLGFTIAHELGHAMGMEHDGFDENGCDPSPYGDNYTVMMYDEMNLLKWGWSECSRNELWAWLDTGSGSCLYDVPQSERYPLNTILPGAAFGVDHQCRFLFGREATVCADVASECNNLKCEIPNEGCVFTYNPLVEGTECGQHQWCYHSKCINQGSRPEAVDGGWSNWGPWSSCSRTCGGGVSHSIRTCNHPPPSHRGLFCTGQRTRYKICNHLPCPHDQPSYRQVQCSEFDSTVYPMTNKTHVWTGIPTNTENPCQLVCENEERLRTILKTEVVDGTPCYMGEFHTCVAGFCKMIPCDLIVDSNAVEDACGVCHGDGSSCLIDSQEIHLMPRNVYQTVATLNESVIFASFEEANPTRAYFIIMSGNQRIFTGLIKAFGTTMYDTMKIWLGQFKHEQDVLKLRGPISKNLTVQVAARDEVTIKVTIGLKRSEVLTTSYKWEFIDWGECSEPCGPGTQICEAKCVEHTNGVVEDKYCNINEKPKPMSRLCEIKACEPRWQIGEWSGCDCTCEVPHNHVLIEERAVDCVKRAGNHDEVIVLDTLCQPPKPESVRDCNCTNRVARKQKYHHEKHYRPVLDEVKNISSAMKTQAQRIKTLERKRGSLVIDRLNLENIDFALQIDEFNKNFPIKNFPRPKLNQSLVHIKGRKAVEYLWTIQKRGHRKYKKKINKLITPNNVDNKSFT